MGGKGGKRGKGEREERGTEYKYACCAHIRTHTFAHVCEAEKSNEKNHKPEMQSLERDKWFLPQAACAP